jgi:hypothetical protein
MTNVGWYWVLACLLAILVSYIELINSLRRIPAPKTWLFVMCRVLIEAWAASLIYSIVQIAFEGMSWFSAWWAVLLSGLCGPALLRAQLALLGSGQETKSLGPANVFRRLQTTIDNQILDIDVVSTDNWISSTVVPNMSHMELRELRDRIATYFQAKHRGKKGKLLVEQLDTYVADTSEDRTDQMRTIIHFVFVNDGKRLIRSLTRNERRLEVTKS